jgi:hypothetical protein
MPDWCHNDITVTHEDPKVVRRFVLAFKKGKLFDEFIPCPKELLSIKSPCPNKRIAKRMIQQCGAPDWYGWRLLNWGTKWDVGRPQGDGLSVVKPGKIHLSVDTAWSPPIAVFDYWVDIGCDVRAKFSEPANEVKGTYKNKFIAAKNDAGIRETEPGVLRKSYKEHEPR